MSAQITLEPKLTETPAITPSKETAAIFVVPPAISITKKGFESAFLKHSEDIADLAQIVH